MYKSLVDDVREHDRAFEEMMKLFEKESFLSRMKRMVNGLVQPKDSGEYKFARLQLQRLSSPVLAIFIPLLCICFLMSLKTEVVEKSKFQAVEISEILPLDQKFEEKIEIKEPIYEFVPVDIAFDSDLSDFTAPDISTTVTEITYSPKPNKYNAVDPIRSPVEFSGITGSRSSGERGNALARYGGTSRGEASVMRALRWLKMKQKADGSWGDKHPTAMTGLAILTYLAHGETPSPECEEFGKTVQMGIKFLTDNVKDNGRFQQLDGNMYAQLIGAYALSEAYAMTRVPAVKAAAERAIRVIIEGQQQGGGFDYKLVASSTRNDLSFSGWATQAIKAAYLAGLDIKKTLPDGSTIDLLDKAYHKCIEGMRANAIGGTGEGGFSYVADKGNSHRGLTGVGVFCLQILGEGNSIEVKNALNFLDGCTFSFDTWDNQPYPKGDNPSPIYYWYYITHAKFFAGGNRWVAWNKMFFPELVSHQNIIPKAIADPKGIMRDVGYWQSPSEQESFRGIGKAEWKDIMDTCLCTLQLMVYYRYLPTFRLPTIISKDIEEDDEITISY